MTLNANAAALPRDSRRALLMVVLMLLSSSAPILTISGVSAHESAFDTIWPQEGSNDTGWVQLDAVGADPSTGSQASASWTLEFAPGADLSNVSFQVRVDGSDGLMIEEPMLVASDIGVNLLDWRGLGMLGSQDSFAGPNPYTGRMNPNSDSGATWTLPSDAEITELVIEALAPVDPVVALAPLELNIVTHAIHPDDGRMYLAIDDVILTLDYANDPIVIDVLEFDSEINDLVMDSANRLLHVLTSDGLFFAFSLDDTSEQTALPTPPDSQTSQMPFDQFMIASNGFVYAANQDGIAQWDGLGWTAAMSKTTPQECLDMIEVDNVLYVSFDDEGVVRWDLNSGSALTTWSTANSLHSDEVTEMMVSGNQLLLASPSNGLARYDWSSGFWLSTWNDGNWLTSNTINGMVRSGSDLFILSGDTLHEYDTTVGVFSSSQPISSFGLTGDGQDFIVWPAAGTRAPATETLLLGNGFGSFAELIAGSTPLQTGTLLIGSGPTSSGMQDATELDGVVFVAADDYMNRFDTQASRWLQPVYLGTTVNHLMNDGSHVFIASENGLHQMHKNGTLLQTWDSTNSGLLDDEIIRVDSDGSTAVGITGEGQMIAVDLTGSATASTPQYDSPAVDLTLFSNTVHLATDGEGVLRYDLSNGTWLTPWISTGVNGADNVPVAVTGDILYFGIPGYGVARKDLSTGELMTPLTEVGNSAGQGSSTGILPTDNIYALEADGSELYIGTSNGAVKWDGSSSSSFQTGGNWNTRPQQYFDFAVSGGTVYAATNIGVCAWSSNQVSSSNPDCLNVYDGMPNWATYSVEADGYGYIFGGTTSGVGIITASPYEVIGEWEAGEQTQNAPVEVIGDIAYIGLDGIGIARYDIPNNAWLTLWTEDNVLDGGNEEVTGLVADINPGQIWIGGDDGFQLLNTTTGAEVYDIEKSSSLFAGNGNPHDMLVDGDVLYYNDRTSSDNVFRIDIANYASLSSLDAGAEVNENGGDVNGMNIVDGKLMVSVSSGQWWNTDGSGGIAQWDISSGSWDNSILPIGQVDRVTAYKSTSGNMWVSWGESNLELIAANGTTIDSWDDDDFDFPIREILEYNGEVLFATEDGVARYNETTNQWLTMWEEGNGLPNNAGSRIYELWTDGTHLVTGGGDVNGFGQFQGGAVSHWDGTTWNQFDLGQSGTPNGYPLSMAMCGGVLNIGIYANNGGVARLDLANSTMVGSFTRADWNEGYGEVAGVACDTTDTLYVAFYEDEADVKKYSYSTGSWITPITSVSNGLPSDRVWWDAIDYANGQLVLGHGIGLSGSNVIGGGFSLISSSGNSNAQASVNGAGSSVTSFQWLGTEWLVGQAGGSSGFSKVETISSLGQNTVATLPGLVSGQVTSMNGNSTHLWVTTAGTNQGQGQSSGAGLLQGEWQTDGSILWQNGWTMAANSKAQDTELIGTDLYISSTPTGLYKLDTLTGVVTRLSGGLHGYLDGMVLDGTTLVLGLMGSGGSAPGVQLYDIQTGYGNGKLLGGLPSNGVNNFAATSDILYIATNGGVGRWDYAAVDWINPLTTSDGLPTNVVEDILVEGNSLWMATPAGLVEMNLTTSATTLYNSASGLMGTSTMSLTTYASSALPTTLFVGHDGAGNERPAVTTIDLSSGILTGHEFDQLPSNNVDALTSDYWGIHIATDIGPMTHWNSTSSFFENGIPSYQVFGWPVQKMVSDGDHILVFGGNGVSIVEARTNSHQNIKMISMPMLTGGTISPDHIWLTTDGDGLYGYENNPQYTEIERVSIRYADPLNVGFNLVTQDITDMTHPGMSITLADLNSTVTLDPTLGVVGTNGIMFQTVPLAFTSPINNAATWAYSKSLKYNATIELNNNPDFETTLQLAVDNGVIVNGTQFLQMTLRSPSNGSMHVRLIYDYVRTETPITMTDLIDRPDDGGGALLANWSLVHDDNFARYLVYVNEGPFVTQSGLPLTVGDLAGRTIDKAISLHSRLSSEVTTANGSPLIDGELYYAVVVVEYDDGHLGTPSAIMGPASPSDEVPHSPRWADAGPHEGGSDGDLEVEWARCTSIDLAGTMIYASTSTLTDVLGLTPAAEVDKTEGNTTVLSLDAGQPYWLALTCADESGQEDIMNPTIIGPVVPTGGLNDNTAPPKMENVAAIDTPDDDGGRITVSWDVNPADDCTFYAIFIRLSSGGTDTETIPSASVASDQFSQAEIVDDCSEDSTIVNNIDGVALQDGQAYYVGVVAYDDWLNANLNDVDLVKVTPLRNTAGSGSVPDRVNAVNAFDHPDDDGTLIDVIWSISDADDFSHYIVWVADRPISDLSAAWAAFGDDEGLCGCLKVNKQWIDEDYNPIELPISTALYGGNSIIDAVPEIIKPDIELYVVVTVHDLAGNVHLTNLPQAVVVPINNLQDVTAPAPLSNLNLYDRPNDDGSALLLDFELSNESDVATYEVYAATWSFDAIGMGSTGPATPIATLSRLPDLPLTIEVVAGDTPVIEGLEIWVAVVVRDTAGNAQEINLATVSAQSVDDDVDDLGGYLDEIENIVLSWNSEENILVEWSHSDDSSVRGYRVYISSNDFTSNSDADFVAEVKASNSFLITPNNYNPLVNTSAWYVAVTPFDDLFEREEVEAIMLDVYGKENTNGDGNQDATNENDFSSLLTTPNLLAAGLLFIAVLLLVAIVRSRGGQRRRDQTLELQEATWGIQDDGWGSDIPPAMPQVASKTVPNIEQENDIYAAAQRIENQDIYGRPAYQPAQPVMQPAQNNALMNDLSGQNSPQLPEASIDTSFLDDLL
tara:strand:- start:41069 stop:49372 length:8304 start_codon:yes stop_codon:yes gene_type:complete